ncbi:hypothetical protein [Empedobacter stercoris]|uniref:Uncharacterized protein n=1 Tax=Empedobacter stercoris TaxID=1628248 RepID=A0ABX1WLZ1_9FLAO|nr:hypothetical protein [Empedobacter stercoris]NOJ75642.1 hypothetical protein [Empedobacter stercoris]
MMRTLLFNLFFILCSLLYAQSTLITGKIMVDDADEVMDLSGATVENLMTKAKAKANSEGLFSINVNLDDELYIKHLGIQDRSLKVTEAMMTKGFVSIHMNVEVIELAETKIKPLKKYWKDNVSKDETESGKINKSLGINQEFKDDMVKAHFAAQYLRNLGVSVRYENVIGLIDQFSDKEVQTYKHFLKKKSLDKYEQIMQLKAYFTDYYFVNDLKIPEGKINEFLDYCYSNFDFPTLLMDNNFDEILFVIEEQAPIYLAKISKNE